MTDAEDMYQNWVTDPEVIRFWGWEPHKDIAETRFRLAGWIEEYERPDNYHWVIVLKSISQAIGYIYLNAINEAEESAAVHYLLSRKFWKQGIMTEALKAVLSFAFGSLEMKRVHTRHHADNPASGRVMQKSGMRYVKTEYMELPDDPQLRGEYLFYEMRR